MSAYQDHKRRWSACKLCVLSKTRHSVVLCRGKLPCTVLFIAEAPGTSEDMMGVPLVGPAGHLFDHILKESGFERIRYAMTNLVACIPILQERSEGRGRVKSNVEPKWIKACSLRLKELVEIAKPKHIVCVGSLSETHARVSVGDSPIHPRYKWHKIIHPSAILRMDVSQKNLAYQRAVVVLQDLAEDILNPVRNVDKVSGE